MSDDCLFCKIARKEVPSKTVHEDHDIVATFEELADAAAGEDVVIDDKDLEHAGNLRVDAAPAPGRGESARKRVCG